jgi:ligand-binding sensor domain-containing protein
MKKATLTLMSALVGLTSFGQQWAEYNTANSPIPSNSVSALLSTGQGTWIGTDHGLALYNGREWEVFDEQNSLLPSNAVAGMANMGHGAVWVATDNGILCTSDNPDEWFVMNASNSPLPNNAVTCILKAASGDVFIGTWGGGLARISNGQWTTYTTANGLPSNGIRSLFVDSYNRLYVSTYAGLAVFNGWQWENMTQTNSTLPHADVRFVVQDGDGNYIIGTADGLMRQDTQGNTAVHTATTLGYSVHQMQAGVQVKDGSIRLATDAGLLCIATDGTIVRMNMQNSELPTNNLRALSVDNADRLHIGTGNKGMVVYDAHASATGTDDMEAGTTFSLYPNPVTTDAQIRVQLPTADRFSISIYDMAGREVRNISTPATPASRFSGQLGTEGLRPGAYTCVLRTSFGRETVKFLVL